jgi:hypothetical protein
MTAAPREEEQGEGQPARLPHHFAEELVVAAISRRLVGMAFRRGPVHPWALALWCLCAALVSPGASFSVSSLWPKFTSYPWSFVHPCPLRWGGWELTGKQCSHVMELGVVPPPAPPPSFPRPFCQLPHAWHCSSCGSSSCLALLAS